MNLFERMQAPTPKFFRVVRNVGLLLASTSAVILASPVVVPAVVMQIALYAGLAGTVAGVVSQAATEQDCQNPEPDGGTDG